MPATIQALQEGRYTIEQELRSKDDRTIFQAYDTDNESPVTIVEVPIMLSRSATAAEREAAAASFAEQAKRLSDFDHKSVLAVRGYFSEGGRNYLATDPVEGVDLATLLGDQDRPFSVAEIADWADTVLDALNLMHNSRPPLVFRNLRPGSIILCSGGSVRLNAAGMICCGDPVVGNGAGPGNSALAFSPLEQIWNGLDAASQKVILSKYDDASERNLKQNLDARSDIFSLGATLYKLATGRTPADALERSIEMIEGNPDPLVSPNKVDPGIPVEVSDVIMKAMEIRREYRFDSAAIMRQVLKTALVRVKEREAEEALVQTVEAASEGDGKRAGSGAKEAEAKEPSPVRVQNEPQRSELPISAAPAAQQNHTPAGRKTETFTLADLEDDLLGLMSPPVHAPAAPQEPVAEAPRHPVTKPEAKVAVAEQKDAALDAGDPEEEEESFFAFEVPDETDRAAGEEVRGEAVSQVSAAEPGDVIVSDANFAEADEADVEPVAEEPRSATLEQELADEPKPAKERIEKFEAPVPAMAAAVAAGFSNTGGELSGPQKGSGGIGLPAIAATAFVLLIAAVGGWFYFGSNAAPPAVAEPSAAEQPAVRSEQQIPPTVPSTDSSSAEITTQPASESPAGEQRSVRTENEAEHSPKTASSAQPKPKKPEPEKGKAPEKKKVVTVDDLINDN